MIKNKHQLCLNHSIHPLLCFLLPDGDNLTGEVWI